MATRYNGTSALWLTWNIASVAGCQFIYVSTNQLTTFFDVFWFRVSIGIGPLIGSHQILFHWYFFLFLLHLSLDFLFFFFLEVSIEVHVWIIFFPPISGNIRTNAADLFVCRYFMINNCLLLSALFLLMVIFHFHI